MGNDCATEGCCISEAATHQLRSLFRGHQSKDTAAYRRFSMRFSVNIIFLGWWMAGQWGMSIEATQWKMSDGGEQPYPKPYASMSSSEIVTLGGNIIISCKNESPQRATFSLYKYQGSSLYLQDEKKAKQNEVIFTIHDAHRLNAGVYQCMYCLEISAKHERCSDYSDEVHINIRDPSLGKPSIKVSSREPLASGLNVTIECQGPGNGLNFSLYKSRILRASQVTQRNEGRAEFSFFIERMEEAASYTCQYSRKEKPFVWSEPSDPVELIARDKNSDQHIIIISAGCAAGVILLFLLLLLAFVLFRKRRKGSSTADGNQPENTPLETVAGRDREGPTDRPQPDGVTYATLNQQSLKTEQAAVPERSSEPCIYASLAKNRIRGGQ